MFRTLEKRRNVEVGCLRLKVVDLTKFLMYEVSLKHKVIVVLRRYSHPSEASPHLTHASGPRHHPEVQHRARRASFRSSPCEQAA